jgi:simple sugar transport system permease protein
MMRGAPPTIVGVTLLMIGGHFDLSVGAVLGLSSYVAVLLMRDYAWSPIAATPAAVTVGALLGAINGAIVVQFRIHSFVVTLGTMPIWRGDRADGRLSDDGGNASRL